MSRRKAELRAKLLAMAQQDASPEEAAIARRKLDAMGPDEEPSVSPAVAHELRETARRREQERAEEAERERLTRRWERGVFSGLRVRMGAGGITSVYTPPPPEEPAA